jgi:1,4-alpha-glucan branching enzyme
VNDPLGHLFNSPEPAPLSLDELPDDPASSRRALTALLAADPRWLHAIDLFNEGFSWEAHEAWEQFWHAFGRTTPEARLVQGLIHLAAAAVKVREGKPAGVTKQTQRARELLDGAGAAGLGSAGEGRGLDVAATALGLDTASLGAVIAELEAYRPECWHTSRFPVVKVLTAGLRVAG